MDFTLNEVDKVEVLTLQDNYVDIGDARQRLRG
jgi:hypothetical protein